METTEKILKQLCQTLCDEMEKTLLALPMKKHVRETLMDGFKAGCHAGIRHTVAMLEVTVKS